MGLFRILNTMVKGASFGRREKLKSRKAIDALFQKGRSVVHFPIRVKYVVLPLTEEAETAQAGFTVSKKYFKRAVQRNRIKRLLREAYRLQKAPLLQLLADQKQSAQLFFIYTDKSLPDYTTVFAAMAQCMHNLQQKIATPHE